jgi:molecular chaperone GrpE
MSDHPRRRVDGRAVRASHGEPPSRPGVTASGAAGPGAQGAGRAPEAAPAGEAPPDVAGVAAAASEAVTTEGVESLRAELAERSDQLLRLAADFENFRRRKAQELADRGRYASEDAAQALLPVLDNLRRAVGHSAGDGGGQQLLDGLRMVVIQFEQALSAIGVEPVETVGTRFDPSVHQAIGGEESDEVSEDTVVAELQPGYRLHDRLLRPALVRVVHPRRGSSAPAGPQV